MDNIGQRIKQKRQELNLTQEELALKMGYKSKSTINKIELGINDIPQSKVVKFSEVLGVSVAYLMGWEEEIQKDPAGMAERHFEILMDEDISGIFDDLKKLDANQRKIVKDLVHSLAETKKTEV